VSSSWRLSDEQAPLVEPFHRRLLIPALAAFGLVFGLW